MKQLHAIFGKRYRGNLPALAVVASLLVSPFPAKAQEPGIVPPVPAVVAVYRDATQPIAARVDDLIGHMTLEEKVAQLQNAAPAIPRLGVPAYDYWSQGLHGIAREGTATVFPQAIGNAGEI